MRFRSLLAAGVALALSIAGPAFAGNISQFTGPAGTNPLTSNPGNLSDLNTIINGVNNNAAFSGTGTPSTVIGVSPVSTSTIVAGAAVVTPFAQWMSTNSWTSTTSTSGVCGITSASGCLLLLDPNGNKIGIPFWRSIP